MKVIDYTINSSKVKEDTNIAILSDIHFNSKTSDKKLNEIISTVKKVEPSHIVIPGDLFDPSINGYSNEDNERLKDLLNNLASITDISYVIGNAEQYGDYDMYYKTWPSCFNSIYNLSENFIILHGLNSDTLCLNQDANNISILGLGIDSGIYNLGEQERIAAIKERYEEYLSVLYRLLNPDRLNILVCHDPIIIDLVREYKKIYDNNVDLIIAGHNHGGMVPKIFKPFIYLCSKDIEKYYPTYVKGHYSIVVDGDMIVSEGITKYNSQMKILEKLEKFHEGTIENIKIRKR